MEQKILFFDYDGTLVDEQAGIFNMSDLTKSALLTLKQNGHLTFLATGRSYFYIPEEIKNYFCGIVSCNGAAVHIGDLRIFKKNITGLDVSELYTFLKNLGVPALFEQDDICIETPWEKEVLYNGLRHFNIRTDGYAQMPENIAEVSNLQLCKCIMFFENPTQHKAVCEKYSTDYELRGGKGGHFYLDFNQKNISKATGIDFVLQQYSCKKENAFAFGDGENDVEMLSCVGNAIAMGKHSPLLDTVATYVCETVKDEGIHRTLVKYGLV